jgi:hypothetical protein
MILGGLLHFVKVCRFYKLITNVHLFFLLKWWSFISIFSQFW